MDKIGKGFLPGTVAVAFLSAACISGALAQTLHPDRYVFCSFRPQAAFCKGIYEKALRDSNPAASAVRAAFDGYGRYLAKATGALTAEDRQYLSSNVIRLPELMPEDQAGLHAVINDPALLKDPESRRLAVNNFLSRAVQAEQFCRFNDCNAGDLIAASTNTIVAA